MAAPTRPTSASQDPWELAKSRFLEDLEPHEKDLFNNATLENIYYSTSNISRDDAEKSKTRRAVRRLGPLVSAIESYGGAFDAFAQISPQYLSPIWGSIRVLLAVASTYSKFYEKIVDTLSRIGDILPRFRDYQRIYNGEKHRRLTRALSNTYLDVIGLCSDFLKSIRAQKASKVRRILKPLAFDKPFDEAIERFRRHKQNVEDEARACHMIEAAEQRDAQLVLFAEERRRKLLAKLSKVESKHRHRRLKESRHEGTGLWLTSCSEYQQWKAASESSVLCCYGIPGCGKSVLVSSVIDAFDASGTLIYYYCDYADKRTLEPNNVFGSLAQQALGNVAILPETLALDIEQADHDGEKMTDLSKVLDLLQKTLELMTGPFYLFLDGLDEVKESSQSLICNKMKQLVESAGLCIKLLITGRDDVGPLLMLDPKINFFHVAVSSNVISLDIEKFIRASTRRLILSGSLVIRDPDLENLIVSELVDGAKGMFLWVEFQLHDLCEPESDHGIRLVLQNLPRSLGETYERLLNRIEGVERTHMIQRMFKWIVCAREPIHLEELREAVAFTLNDVDYDPQKLPTDLSRLIRACGNLVVIDNETQVVQLAHHTVQQYLLQQGSNSFQFTIKAANIMAGDFCIAYLCFSNFESQVTRYAENKNTDMIALGRIASRGPILPSDYPGQRVVRAWNTLRNPQPTTLHVDMTRHVPSRKKGFLPTSFAMLSYVIAHWLWHTVSFDLPDDNCEDRRERLFKRLILWKQLLFEFRPWGSFDRGDSASSSISLIGWALMTNHAYLIRTAFSTISSHFPGQLWLPTGGLWQALDDDRLHSVTRHLTLVRGYPFLGEYRFLGGYWLHTMQKFSSLEYPDAFWLFTKLLWACRNGHIDAIRELDLATGLFRGPIDGWEKGRVDMAEYLLVAAAADGKLEVVQYLRNSPTRPDGACWAASQLSKGYYLTAIEHAAILGHSHVVIYLESQGFRPNGDLFTARHVFNDYFDTATKNGDLRAANSLLLLRGFWRNNENQSNSIGVENAFEVIDQHLSDILVKSIVDGHTELARLLLTNGIDPNLPDQGGCTPLIAAI